MAIGDQQQGFVHGRLINKSIMAVMSLLNHANKSQQTSLEESPGIVLLEFAKAYDTVDRRYLYEVLRMFGLLSAFVNLIKRLHDDTTAQFVVNSQHSHPISGTIESTLSILLIGSCFSGTS